MTVLSQSGLWIRWVFLIALMSTAFGCATYRYADDALIRQAEQTSFLSFQVIDKCLKWEYEHRTSLPESVKNATNTLREQAPKAIGALRETTKRYKATRDLSVRAELTSLLVDVECLQGKAITILTTYADAIR